MFDIKNFGELLTTEFGRIIAMFLFFYFVMKPVKKDLHELVEKIQKIYIKMENHKSTDDRSLKNEDELVKLKDKLHSIEIESIKRS